MDMNGIDRPVANGSSGTVSDRLFITFRQHYDP